MAIGQEEIGRRIAQARDDAELTQAELADRIGVATAQSISRYERGETEVPTRRLRRIAEATGKPMDYFVLELPGGTPEVSPDQLVALVERVEEVLAEVRQLRALVEPLVEDPPATEPDTPPGHLAR